jgi:phosphate transport system substrate-binding protein
LTVFIPAQTGVPLQFWSSAMTSMIRLIATAVLISATLGTHALADMVKLVGATTVVDIVITPNRVAAQKVTGHTLEIAGSSNGEGLVALSDRKADAAMISEPLDIAVAAAEVVGKRIDSSKLQMHELRKDEIVFLVNASNAVSKLTPVQLRDIYTGKISNWKQVGGKDLAITVYSDAQTGGTHAMVKRVVMGGSECAGGVKLTSVWKIAELVQGDESAIGSLSNVYLKADGRTKVIETTRIERSLAIVTFGSTATEGD